jgi:hypothetical protein
VRASRKACTCNLDADEETLAAINQEVDILHGTGGGVEVDVEVIEWHIAHNAPIVFFCLPFW